MEDVTPLWSRYVKTGDDETRNKLIEHYLPLVQMHARRTRSRLPNCIDEGDLVTAGVFGLMDAISSFDPSRGYKFETFCVRRITGAMLDELRALDWTPRLARRRAALVQRAVLRLRQINGVDPTDEELAAELGIRGEEFKRVRRDADITCVTSLQTRVGASRPDYDDAEGAELMADEQQIDPAEKAERLGMQQAMMNHMDRNERLILTLYHREGMSMHEIGRTLGMSESRISQLHKHLLHRLQSQFGPRAERLAAVA